MCLASTLLASGGCIRPLPQTTYRIKGQVIDPPFPHLKGKKVAVVCHDENGLSDGADSVMLARYVQAKLSENVKNIKFISPENVDKWLNENGSREPDCNVLGKSVEADFVLAIKLANMSLRDESHSVYKGKADITVTVYDISKGGTMAFRKSFLSLNSPRWMALRSSTRPKASFASAS